MCREPLAPAGAACDFSRYLASAAHWLAADAPYTTYAPCQTLAAAETLDRVTEILANAERGLVIVGQLKNAREAEAVRNLARALGWPVFPDIASGLRLGVRDERVIPYFDQLLLSARFQKHCAPGTVLQIGSPFVSKRLLQQLEACPPRAYVHVADHPCRHDPIHRISLRIETDAAAFCEQIAARLPARETSPWLLPFQEGTAKVHTEIESFIERDSGLHEPTVARALSELMAEDTVFFLGNSLPIRDVERFASPQGRQVRIAVNRGASGIDGDIATAAGYAAALRRPVTVLLGDLALLHDLNSLALLRELDAPMVVVVLNNNGGGIFSFLPIAGATPHFERFFATPHGLAFQHAAELFDLRYYAPDSRPAFVAAYRDAVQGRAGALIEVRTEREENVRVHRALQEAIAAALDTVPVPSQR
jgi:2-succinyl-5-enolpyruvyl-6-hydroxy-3-cyclohexene-1-carboxylate synthase